MEMYTAEHQENSNLIRGSYMLLSTLKHAWAALKTFKMAKQLNLA
jgi:hypothetical protein